VYCPEEQEITLHDYSAMSVVFLIILLITAIQFNSQRYGEEDHCYSEDGLGQFRFMPMIYP